MTSRMARSPKWRRLGAVATLALILLSTGPAGAQTKDLVAESARGDKRVALVIGNARYTVGPLNSPVRDARAMAQSLRGFGFDVLTYEDVDYQGMRRAVAAFGERLATRARSGPSSAGPSATSSSARPRPSTAT